MKLSSKIRNKFRSEILIMILLSVGFLISSCAGPIRSVAVHPSSDEKGKGISCSYPIEPSNPLALMIFYKDAMRYITDANESCRQSFSNELKKEVQSSALTPEGCVKVTLEDIEDALYHPEELQKRLKY
jgi:hypothetical protein